MGQKEHTKQEALQSVDKGLRSIEDLERSCKDREWLAAHYTNPEFAQAHESLNNALARFTMAKNIAEALS